MAFFLSEVNNAKTPVVLLGGWSPMIHAWGRAQVPILETARLEPVGQIFMAPVPGKRTSSGRRIEPFII